MTGTVNQIGNGNTVKFPVKCGRCIPPCCPDRAFGGPVTFFRKTDTVNQVSLGFKKPGNFAQCDGCGRLTQKMSAFGPANALYKSGNFQFSQELFQVFDRNFLAGGNLADLDRTLVLFDCKFDKDAGAVPGFCGKFHPFVFLPLLVFPLLGGLSAH